MQMERQSNDAQLSEIGRRHISRHNNLYNSIRNGIIFLKRRRVALLPYISFGFEKILFILLFFITAICYYHNVEGWTYLECMYFLTVTITTIGYGDITPTSDKSRVFTIFVIIFGVFGVTPIVATSMTSLVKTCFDNVLVWLWADEGIGKTSKIDPKKAHSHWLTKICFVVGFLFIMFMIAVLYMTFNDGFNFSLSLYWTVVSLSSVGYGDVRLDSDEDKAFVIIFVFAALFALSASVSIVQEIMDQEAERKQVLRFLNAKLDMESLAKMDTTGEGVDKLTFVTHVLSQLGVLDYEKHVQPWLDKFEEFDKDGSGRLDRTDLALMEKNELKARRLSLSLFEDDMMAVFDDVLPVEPDVQEDVLNPIADPNNSLPEALVSNRHSV